MPRFLIGLTLAGLLPFAVHAQTVLSGNHSVDGALCVGDDCTGAENFPQVPLKLKNLNTRIVFQDTSSSAGYASNDWRLEANGTQSNGANYFAIVDAETSNQILRLDAGAPANSVYVDGAGKMGLGTMIPQADIHVISSGTAKVRLERSVDQGMDIGIDAVGFYLKDLGTANIPFAVDYDAPTSALYITSSGRVGLGTNYPEAALHIIRGNNTAAMLIEDTGAGTLGQLTLRNNGITF
ncbi:hypothetical protein ATO6_24530, partial [Oceanicola sp. 22II-s10i]|uniref:hypothetical protein n=1 Tax=Oceanicola sp. 22II-s10i TaxID=1317116 RepID=UPI000B658228